MGNKNESIVTRGTAVMTVYRCIHQSEECIVKIVSYLDSALKTCGTNHFPFFIHKIV